MPKTTLHAEIPVQVKDEFKAVADANGRKITAELVRAMLAHIRREKKRQAEGGEEDDE